MILINLLPHREAARKRRRDLFNATLAAAVMAGAFISALIYGWYVTAIGLQQSTNAVIKAEIGVLESQIKDIQGLETEIAALRARQEAVENLQSDRNLPVHLLTELVRQLPDGVYLTKMTQQDQIVSLNGVAQSNERISEMLRNLANNTPWFSKPELVEIVSGTVTLSTKEVKRVANFGIRVRLVPSSEAEKDKAEKAGPTSKPAADAAKK